MKNKIIAKDKDHLLEIIEEELIDATTDDNYDLTHIDVSNITDMSCLFDELIFQINISNWDVSNVTNMRSMFFNSKFNGDISIWNTKNVTNMNAMFTYSEFNDDISNWDVSSVDDMEALFYKSEFSGDISNWNVINLENTNEMFIDAKCPIPYWINIKNIEDRKIAVQKYQEAKQLKECLDDSLNNKLTVKNKVKI